MRVLFAGGGTAGHINPAISIADYIKTKEDDFEALFIGTERGLEKKLVPASGYKIKYIDIRGFDRKNLLKNVSVVMKLIKSRLDCQKIIKDFKPDFVVLTGGYVSGPVAMAAKKAGVPALIHEQNVYPGLTVKGAEKYVNYVALSFEESIVQMKDPKKCVVTGNPVRCEILTADKDKARDELGLSEKPFVLVFGGSLGAQKINETMIGVLKKAAEERKFSILFATGDRNYQEVIAKLSDEKVTLDDEIKVVPYINNMSTVMAAADLVVSRAGAITVSEIAALAKPSILIPSPNVTDNHQEKNARALADSGAAVLMLEKDCTAKALYTQIKAMLDDSACRDRMHKTLQNMVVLDSAERLCQIITELAKEKNGTKKE